MAAGVAAALLFGALLVLLPDHLLAHEPQPAAPASRLLPLDFRDELATLEAVHTALSEVEDRSTYIWQARSGRISGMVELTTSFKDRQGKVCRHLILTLVAADTSRRSEGIACREANGVWSLEG